MRDPEYDRFSDRRVQQQRFLGFGGSDFFPSAIDDLFCSADDRKKPVCIDDAEIAGHQPLIRRPAVWNGIGTERQCIDIARRYALPPYGNCTRHSMRKNRSITIEDRHIGRDAADRAGLSLANTICTNSASLTHPVELKPWNAEDFFQSSTYTLRKISAGGDEKAERVPDLAVRPRAQLI